MLSVRGRTSLSWICRPTFKPNKESTHLQGGFSFCVFHCCSSVRTPREDPRMRNNTARYRRSRVRSEMFQYCIASELKNALQKLLCNINKLNKYLKIKNKYFITQQITWISTHNYLFERKYCKQVVRIYTWLHVRMVLENHCLPFIIIKYSTVVCFSNFVHAHNVLATKYPPSRI